MGSRHIYHLTTEERIEKLSRLIYSQLSTSTSCIIIDHEISQPSNFVQLMLPHRPSPVVRYRPILESQDNAVDTSREPT